MLSCSVIIIAYNSCDFIPACLKSVRDACEGIDSQIIVLDNGSTEPIIPEIKNFFPEVEWIDSKENLGFGKGCNLAEKHATKPYLFFINPDTIISKNAFREMLKFMEEHPEAGTVGCRILNEDGTLQWACRRSFPTIVSAVSKTIGLAAMFPKSKTLASYNMTYADPDEMIEVDAISGSFFCIRRDVYETLNGFDEDYFMYGEDLDLCFRTKQMGLKNYYTPVTNILHFKGQSCRTRRWGSYVDFYKAMLIFVKKHKDLYFVPNFLVSFGILFAAFVGMFSRLIPKFWKMFLDLGVVAIWAFFILCYETGVFSTCLDCAGKSDVIIHSGSEDWILAILAVVLNIVFLMFRGEYTVSSLAGEKFLHYLIPLNLLIVGGYSAFRYFTQTPVVDGATTYLPYGSHWITLAVCSSLFIPLALLAWRRIAFWINYFYRIFAKKRHRSILLGGREDSLNNWFDSYNVIPGIEILGCVSSEPEKLSEENRKHLLGPLSDMESICNRTGCRELLVVSNFSGYREEFNMNWLDKLGMCVYLLIGNGKNGNFALVNLKYLR
ncbi:glycosyltransferase family 2 protein [Fibrobacter sp. UWB13]|uniref:glycosyltransferase family 2 protein n=1 Tax=Fibrobacter sp. UWB13 TaxID=1896204 RepID=UPI000A0B649F|nr:glycosyltransferase [Fibrobacter sp. UWB13]SMG14812.1 Glycosyltransferase, GT2 family [Fibrobacter sp. UWB13]